MEQFKVTEIEKKWPFDKAQGKQEYDHTVIESYWQGVWERTGIYEPDLDKSQKPFYNLMMFPYPSFEGLHVGNMYAFTGSDIYGRYMRMRGFDVFEPIGLDGFGIHSENYALKIGQHPAEVAKRTEANFYRQLHAIGNAYSWSNKLETYKSNYYKWTQWIFVQLFKAGLTYRARSAVNWCPHCLTVLADEQVIQKLKVKSEKLSFDKLRIILSEVEVLKVDKKEQQKESVAVCERCGTQVEKRELAQWFFRITKYAQKLLDGLEKIDWSEKVKIAQRNWLGKSEGLEILFGCDIERNTLIRVFTTRADTIFGVTFLALAPEHPLVTTIGNRSNKLLREQIQRYVSDSLKKSEEERIGQFQDKKDKVKQAVKTGIDTGFCAINPINGKKVPIFIADYVLATYGTGAVMGVPAHDVRDWEFAKKFKLEIIQVIKPDPENSNDFSQKAFTDYGVLVNSGKFTGLSSEGSIQSITKYLQKHHFGSIKAMWHLRDWIISRQRYWGPPIPMIFCQECAKDGKSWFTEFAGPVGKSSKFKVQSSKLDWDAAGWYPVPEDDLPVELPYIKNFKPTHSTHSAGSVQASSGQAGLGPLARHPEFYLVKCPGCASQARRETDVSDTFLDSAWYYLGYLILGDQKSKSEVSQRKSKNQKFRNWELEFRNSLAKRGRWLPVDMYIGGAEHAVLHLLYSRFLAMVFADLGFTDFDEPFSKFRAHGLLISKGAKMSKSKGNVVIPDDYIEKYGSDTLRCYLMFCGRYQQGGDFRDSGIEGMHRFLKRVWRLVAEATQNFSGVPRNNAELPQRSAYLMHKTIKKVTSDIESLDYNTAIAALMEWVNALEGRVVDSDESVVNSQKQKKLQTTNYKLPTRVEVETLLLLLAPFAPHITEELWSKISADRLRINTDKNQRKSAMNQWESIHQAPWPKYDGKLAIAQSIVLVVEVNGKVRDRLSVERGVSENEAKGLALALAKVTKYVGGKKIKRVIFVRDRLINLVI